MGLLPREDLGAQCKLHMAELRTSWNNPLGKVTAWARHLLNQMMSPCPGKGLSCKGAGNARVLPGWRGVCRVLALPS